MKVVVVDPVVVAERDEHTPRKIVLRKSLENNQSLFTKMRHFLYERCAERSFVDFVDVPE